MPGLSEVPAGSRGGGRGGGKPQKAGAPPEGRRQRARAATARPGAGRGDGRSFPKDEEATWSGYSIGKWLDTDNDGRFDTLEVETRNFKGPRVYEASGIPLHLDNESIIRERIALDKQNKDLLRYEITTIDHALTKPWTVLKTFRRERNVLWSEDQC